jgi:hypothetical protein
MKFYKKSVRRSSKYTGSIHKETPKKAKKNDRTVPGSKYLLWVFLEVKQTYYQAMSTWVELRRLELLLSS